ncbi:AmiS/UreI family transporter (plasmid) [Marinovum sp. KMM 9989]
MLVGLVLFYVGAVLVLNGLWLADRISDREIIVINLVVATISFVAAGWTALTATDIVAVRSAAMTLLFAITYLWVAYNRMTGADGRGLGWFSLFVAITVIPMAVLGIASAETALGVWLGASWAVWSGLWLMYFGHLALNLPIRRGTALATLLTGVFTGWLPGLLLLYGVAV